MSEPNKAVFLSYASQDAEAARGICEALRAAGVEVWFDVEGGLEHGDEWDAKIRQQIKECVLFIPLISASTQARHEGYFRLEWDLAAERARLIASGVPFILPVVVDDTPEPAALVPDRFRAVQWTRLKGGEVAPDMTRRFVKLWAQRTGASPVESGAVTLPPSDDRRGETKRRPMARWWWALAAAGLAAVGVAISQRRVSDAHELGRPADQRVSTSLPEIVSTLARVNALLAKIDITRAELDLATDLLAKAARLDPSDARVFAAWALVDWRYVSEFYDPSRPRRDSAQRHASQAAGLDPAGVETRLVRAVTMPRLLNDATAQAEATRLLEGVARDQPDNWHAYPNLAWLAARAGDPDRARDWFSRWEKLPGQRAAAIFSAALLDVGNKGYAGGLAAVETALAQEKAVKFLLWKSYLQTIWLGDVAAARRTLAEVPAEYFGEDMPASAKFLVEFWSRDYESALATVRAIPRDYLQSGAGAYPTGYYRGLCLDRLGKSAAADSEWRAALTIVERRLEQEGNGQELLLAKALLLSALKDKMAAERVWRTARELYGVQGQWLEDYLAAHQLSVDDAITRLQRQVQQGDLWCTAAVLRLNPMYDHLRGDSRFAALQAAADADPRFSPAAKSAAPISAGAAPDSKSVAVLAFANLSEEKDNEYFSDGISEELLNVLAKVPGLKVSARTSAFYFKGKQVQIADIARQLGVAYVVEGSVRKVGTRVRITAQLIKAADGFHVWSENFDRELKDIFAVQDEIAGLIANNLSLRLGAAARPARTVNPEAHRLVLEGRNYWYQRSGRTEDVLEKAAKAFQGALALDPQFAEAYAGLADVWVTRGLYRSLDGKEETAATDYAQARAAAGQALELNPALAEPHVTLGYTAFCERRFAEAERHYARAFAANPNYALAYHWHALLLASEGRLDEGLPEVDRSLQLDPLSPNSLWTAAAYNRFAGRLPQSLAAADRALELRPGVLPVHGDRALTLLEMGRNADAIAAAREVGRDLTIELRWWADSEAIYVLREAGQAAEAAEYARRVLERFSPGDYRRAYVLGAMGRGPEALAALTTVPSLALGRLYFSSMWDAWRNDPRFEECLRRLGCLEEYKAARALLARSKQPTGTKP